MENLEDLKVGDKVVVTNGFWKRVDTVTRLTKTLVIVGNTRFNKSDGFEYGDDKPRIEKEIESITIGKPRKGWCPDEFLDKDYFVIKFK